MSPPIKPRRVDFCAGDWLGGTQALSLNQRGIYITACALIYEAQGPIRKDDLKRLCPCRLDTFNANLLHLIDKGKLQLCDGMIDQARCEREIAKARDRIANRRHDKTDPSFGKPDPQRPRNDVSMTDRRRIGDGSAETSPHVLNDTNELADPHARAKATKLPKERSKILEGGRGVAALPVEEPAPAPEPERAASSAGPPTPEQIAEVNALVSQATAALRGGVPKGIRDAVAYGAAIKANKFTALVKNLNAWAGSGLDGDARMAAWEVLAAAERAGARSGMSRTERRNFDRLAGMYRATGPPDDMAQAA